MGSLDRIVVTLATAKEAEMELRVNLNALVALTSFAFLTAIVLGMI
jgi:hypothetical protein